MPVLGKAWKGVFLMDKKLTVQTRVSSRIEMSEFKGGTHEKVTVWGVRVARGGC